MFNNFIFKFNMYIKFKTKYIINYFRMRWIRINFLFLLYYFYYMKIKSFISGIVTIILNHVDDSVLLLILIY